MKWTIGIVLVMAVGYSLILLVRQGQQPRPGEVFPIQGQEHIAIGAIHEAYNSNPPTSGPHYTQPANWGVYQTELADEQVMHNLEHGGIWISYTEVDDATKAVLEKIAKSNSKIIVTP